MIVTIYIDVPAYAKTASDLWIRTDPPTTDPGSQNRRYQVTATLPSPDMPRFGEHVVAQVEELRKS